MGLFSGKKIISVSSTLYNIAGPEEDRPNFLKSTLFSAVMADSPSLADNITQSYFSGPGIKQRQFFSYADRNDLAGLPTVTATNNFPVDSDTVKPEIPIPATPAGLEVNVLTSFISDGDPEFFIQEWILNNHPARIDEDWVGEYEGVSGLFSVQFPNGDYFSFSNAAYSPSDRYIIARYLLIIPDNTQPWVIGTPTTVAAKTNLTGWDTISESGSFTPVVLNRTAEVTEEFSDGSPDNVFTEPANENAQLSTSEDIYERKTFVGRQGYQTEVLYERYTYTGTDTVVSGYSNTTVTTETLPSGVVKTTTRVVTGEQVNVQFTEQLDTQQILESTVHGPERVFIYKIGTGKPTLDALAGETDSSNFQEFFPFLPLRLDNKSLREAPYDTNGLYTETKKAYRRSTDNKNINKVLDDIEEHENVDDIDYAYMIYGVSLNVQEQACRKYAFTFFEKMMQFQNSDAQTILNFENQIQQYQTQIQALQDWEASSNPVGVLFNSTRPEIPHITVPPTTTLKLFTESPLMPSFDIRLQWVHIDRQQFTGQFTYTDPLGTTRNAKKGEVQFKKGPDITWTEREGDGDRIFYNPQKMESMFMYFQVSDTEYRRLQIYGLVHYNYIYGGKAVITKSSEALDDTDISGFVVPLHYPTMRELTIVEYTQMATANVHILFNSYTVTRRKWWQSWFFKFLIVILVIVAIAFIFPGALAGGAGILGSNVAVGGLLGLTGTAAIVAGAVANYLAAIIVSEVLKVVGTQLFGEKWGALFAAIATFALGAMTSGFALNADTFLRLGSALANGYAGWVQGDIAEMQDEFKEKESDYEKKMDYINKLIAGLGGNDLNFNPLQLTDSLRGNGSAGSKGYTPETADEFIRRTTMTGSDVVEITHAMVYDFVEVQQTLPKN